MSVECNGSHHYPRMWVRWVRQQVSVAVSLELTVSNRLATPHLRRLPLIVTVKDVDVEQYLRRLIAAAAARTSAERLDRVEWIDIVTSAVLADEAVSISEPDLETMVAWRLAQYHTLGKGTAAQEDLGGEWIDHECLDPETVAADLVRSGLIAPAWKVGDRTEAAAGNGAAEATVKRSRRGRRPVSPLQIALPIGPIHGFDGEQAW